ncbi:MAG: hypothetical protein JO163_15855 [Methylobacteriaceae bacterium]|nr:hypothetical protein [Methylobacteriaceae bacterium]
MSKIPDLQLASFLAAQGLEQQLRQDRTITLALDGILAGRREQLARLMIADRRRLAFAALGLRPLDAFGRIVGDGILLAEMLEQRGERRQTVSDGRAAELAGAARRARRSDAPRVTTRNSSGRRMPAKRMKSFTAFS